MKQIVQSLKDGKTTLIESPCPQIQAGHLLVRTITSVVSPGTEKMLLEFGKSNLLQKAKQQPDKVKMVLNKMQTDGVLKTLETVKSKLDTAIPLGYCNVGEVIEVGEGVTEFSVGDRVVSNGHHAEMVCVPKNLSAQVPDNVKDEQAAFTVLAAIALQGIRLAQPTMGETFVVTGLGLVGLLAVQLLKANGCRVIGIDVQDARLALAKSLGVDHVINAANTDPLKVAETITASKGVDGVLICAATSSNDPVHHAAQMSRKRGRIVLVGVTGLELSRADFFEKELTFQVSCSYGPGRYDDAYEKKGQDYPIGFVRWTEQRNFEAVLALLSDKKIETASFISHRFAFDDAEIAYQTLMGEHDALGIVLDYPKKEAVSTQSLLRPVVQLNLLDKKESVSLGFIGAGGYASSVLIPAFSKAGANLHTVATQRGSTAALVGKKFGFENASSDPYALLQDESIDAVVVATRHHTHAHFVIDALKAKKHVFVEKPLCLTQDELTAIQNEYNTAQSLLMVGFNRRFSPYTQKIKTLLNTSSSPKSFVMTINAGMIPRTHWTQDINVGGGRIVGEACHFIDLLRYLAGAQITSYHMTALPTKHLDASDTATLSLKFADGSIGTVHYFANGHRAVPKERLDIFCDGKVLQLNNFKSLKGFGWPGFKSMKTWSQDKGQHRCVSAFMDALLTQHAAPIPAEELFEVANVTLSLKDAE